MLENPSLILVNIVIYSLDHAVSPNPRQVGIRCTISINAPGSMFSSKQVGNGERAVPVRILTDWYSSGGSIW